MSELNKPSWQDQLTEVKNHIGEDSDQEMGQSYPRSTREISTLPRGGMDALGLRRPKPGIPQVSPFGPSKPSGPPDSVEIDEGRLTVKSPAGDVSITLPKEAQAEFVRKALQYQQAIIGEKKANTAATFAMAALSGLSALAIAVTLARSSFSKNHSIGDL